MPASIFSISIPLWILIIFSFLIAFGITWFTIPSIVNISRQKGLCTSLNGRTSHNDATPTFGGIAVFAGFLLSTVIFAGRYFNFELLYIISGLTIVLFMGIKDDVLVIDPWKKLAGQILATVIISVFGDIRISNLYGLFGINQLPYIISILLTIAVFLVIINGFNLIDGIDGLASSIGVLASSVFGIWYWTTNNIAYAVFSYSIAGSLVAFFYFNVFSKKNKLFLGDTGSLVTGLLLGVLAIHFLQLEVITNGAFDIQASPAIALGILIIPLFDTLRVFTLRLLQGKSPFIADRQHIHHRLLQLGLTHLKATVILVSVNLFFIGVCFLLQGIGTIWLTGIIFGMAGLISYILMILIRENTNKAIFAEYVAAKKWKRKNKNRQIKDKRDIAITLHSPSKVRTDLK